GRPLGNGARGPFGVSGEMPSARNNRVMRMNERHVAAVARELPDPGSSVFVGRRAATDEDYQALLESLVAGAPEGGFWAFAYGSLIWNPAFDFVDKRVAVAHGWRRA